VNSPVTALTHAPKVSVGEDQALSDVETLREQARLHLADGAVTAGYGDRRDQILALLDVALATELVCMLRYRRHHFMARGAHAKTVAEEFLVHSAQEQQHADWLAERIAQLGGAPDFAPDSLVRRSHAQYMEGVTLADMIRENLVAERIAIDSYREFIAYLGSSDPTTRRLLETILATEEEHADELAALLQDVPTSLMPRAPLYVSPP
jgi:bacterioferritin